MTQPSVTITELDGALGVLPPSAGRLLAVVGGASKGPVNTPATYARVRDLVADFGDGLGVEAAAAYIDRYARPVVFTRVSIAAAGTTGSVTHTGTGTSVGTIDAASAPLDDYEVRVSFVVGGTRGTAGATYQVSLDGGRNYGPVTALGTATAISAGGVTLNLAAGTFVAGDEYAARSTAPQWTSTELSAALTALGNSAVHWEQAHIVGAIDPTAFDAIELKFAGMAAAGKYRSWIGSVRMPNSGESESAYSAALATAWASKASIRGALCAGACKMISGVSGRAYRRPVSFPFAVIQGGVSEEVDVADVSVGNLTGVSIRDVNGNVDEHDESINPGLDDLRFVTLRTWDGDGLGGVYVNRPRLFSADGSDFQLVAHRRVLNLAHGALRAYFVRRLSKPVLVSQVTGYILEPEALEIEAGARQAMADVLLAKPKASGVQFTLSRVDNILSSKTLTGDARVTPLAYPEAIDLEVGFFNPALQAQQVAA
jgi:hypothetical protein